MAGAGSLIDILNRSSPGAVRLAQLASLAARVEPELLRALRLRHLPSVDSGAEGDLWFSPLVKATSPLGMVFRDDVLEALRQDLKKNETRSSLEKIGETIRSVHENLPPAVLLEEKVAYLSVIDAPESEIEAALLQAVATLEKKSSNGMARWSRRVMARFPEHVRKTNAAQRLAAQSAALLGAELPGDLPAEAVQWIERLAPENIEKTSFGVRLLVMENSLKWEISHPPAENAYPIEAPRTDPIALELEWGQDFSESKPVPLPLNNFVTFPFTGSEIKLRTGLGKTYLIQAPHQGPARKQGFPEKKEYLETGGSPAPGLTLRSVLRGHTGRITRMACSPDGRQLASISEDRTVRIWDTQQGRHTAVIDEQGSSLCWSPDGRYLVTGSDDNSLRLWNSAGWKIERSLGGHTNTVSCIQWSHDGSHLASGSYDNTVRIWDANTFEPVAVLSDHNDWVRSIAWSPDSSRIASGGDDQQIMLYSAVDFERLRALTGHGSWVRSIAWSPDGGLLFSGSDDRSIRIWDPESGALVDNLESHADAVLSMDICQDGSLMATKSADGTVQIWQRRDRWTSVASLVENIDSYPDCNLAFNPRISSQLATYGEAEQIIRLWEIDPQKLSSSYSPSASIMYTTAKIVLVGDSGTGKTGLGWRLAHNEFKEHASTHGQLFWVISQLSHTRQDGTVCEAVMWDMAGQYIYRSLASIFLDDVDAAIVVFDPTNREEPLKGAEFWIEQLKRRKQLPPTILVGARLDRGAPVLSQSEIDQFCQRHGISGGYIGTSAKTGEGLDALLESLIAQIPWDQMTTTVTTIAFKRIKDFVLSLKEKPDRKGVLVRPVDLHRQLQKMSKEWEISETEMMAAVGHLVNHGFVSILHSSSGEEYILLAPDLQINIASTVYLLADKNSRELGAIDEAGLLQGQYKIDEFKGLEKEEQLVLLDATIIRFIERSICFRENLGDNSLLVFPNLIKQKRALADDLPSTDGISYIVRGRVENIYASLVVLLGYTPSFNRIHQWQNQAQYETDSGNICGFRLVEDREGEIELVLYYGDYMPEDERNGFQILFEQFLYQHDVEVTPLPPVICPNGHLQERTSVLKRLREGRKSIFCDECGTRTELPDMGGQMASGPGVPDWLKREEATARLRNAYESHLVKVKGYRRSWAPPRCYISHVSEQKEFAERLAHDLADAGIIMIEDPERVKPDDSIIVIDSPSYKRAWENNQVQDEVKLVRLRLSSERRSGLIYINQAEPMFEHTLEQCKSESFYDPTHYVINLFDLVLGLYAIPMNHAGFIPLRQSLHQQWEQTLAPRAAFEETAREIKPNALAQKEIFVSYAWGGESEKLVDEIDRVFLRRGVAITRDKRDLGYKGSIKEFLERIDRGRCIVIVISDKYLKSKNCMFELHQITESRQFRDRVFPVVLSDANIYDAVKRLEYIKYWEVKKKELNEAIRTVGTERLQGIREEIELYDDFRDEIAKMMDTLQDMNTLSPDLHRDQDFQALYDAVMKKLGE